MSRPRMSALSLSLPKNLSLQTMSYSCMADISIMLMDFSLGSERFSRLELESAP